MRTLTASGPNLSKSMLTRTRDAAADRRPGATAPDQRRAEGRSALECGEYAAQRAAPNNATTHIDAAQERKGRKENTQLTHAKASYAQIPHTHTRRVSNILQRRRGPGSGVNA